MNETIDLETGEVTEESTALVRSTGSELSRLSLRVNDALEVVSTRVRVLEKLRQAAIQLTNPEDWLLYRNAESGRETAYLQDCGCERIRDLFEIDIFNIQPAEKISDGTDFVYLIVGDGRCRFTGKTIESVEGSRSSTDDFVKYKSGIELQLAVRKAARANLDGSIVRELTGMSSVPREELDAAWEGMSKTSDRCVKARGYGSGAERRMDDPSLKCPKCGSGMRFVKAGFRQDGSAYDPFYSCRNYPKCKGVVRYEGSVGHESDEPEVHSDPIPEPTKRGKKKAEQVDLPTGDDIFGGEPRGDE